MIISVSYLAPGDYASLSKSESASLPARLSNFARTTRLLRGSVLAGLSTFSNCPDLTVNHRPGPPVSRRTCDSLRASIVGNSPSQRRFKGDGWGSGMTETSLSRERECSSRGTGKRHGNTESKRASLRPRAKVLKVAIRLEPAARLGAQRDDVMAGPEPGEQLEDQRGEPRGTRGSRGGHCEL